MPKPSTILIAAALALSAGAASGEGTDWPQWLGPWHNGRTPEQIATTPWPQSGPKVLWKTAVGTGFSSVAVADGRAYTLGHQGGTETIYCFDAATGKRLWRHSYPCDGIARYYEGGSSATPTIHRNRLIAMGKEGQVFCLEATTGAVVWEADMRKIAGARTPEWGFASSALIEGGAVIFQAGATVAMNPDTGKVLWKSKKYRPSYTTPAAFGEEGARRLAVLNSEALVILDLADGREIASTRWKTSFNTNSTTPLVSADTVFVSTGYGKGSGLFRLAGRKLEPVYTNRVMANHMNNCVLVDGHLYGFDGNGHNHPRPVELVCMELATGKQKWRHAGLGCGSLIVAGNTLVILGDKGKLVLAKPNPAAFEPITEAQVLSGRCWTSPSVAQGRIYCRNARGDLVCLDAGSGR